MSSLAAREAMCLVEVTKSMSPGERRRVLELAYERSRLRCTGLILRGVSRREVDHVFDAFVPRSGIDRAGVVFLDEDWVEIQDLVQLGIPIVAFSPEFRRLLGSRGIPWVEGLDRLSCDSGGTVTEP